MEGRSLFIVMGPPTAKAERRDEDAASTDGASVDGAGETIGEALQAKGQVPEVGDEPPAAAPA
jgi:hypothetical protein